MDTDLNQSEMVPKLLNLTAIVISFLGLVVLSFGLFLAYMAYGTSSWPSIKAKVIESTVARVETNTGVRYRPVVKYRFSLGGHEFTGDSLRFIDISYGNQQEASEVAAEFPVGMEVNSRFNASNPNMTVLQPGIHLSDLFLPTVGAALIVTAFVLRFVRNRYIRKGLA